MVTPPPTINLSLEEFSREVALLLEQYNLLGAAMDNRVSPIPDARTIRYYTTLGLLDRPSMEGRQAKYGRRHLLQLLAIKALQGVSLPLSEIQARLYGRANEELEHLLASMASRRERKISVESLKPVIWREIVIEPGLKVMVHEGWSPQSGVNEVTKIIGAILEALQQAPPGSDGGKTNE